MTIGGKAGTVLLDPRVENLERVVQHVTHRCAAFGHGIDPDRHLAGNLDHFAGFFVGNDLSSVLDARRMLADFLDRDDGATCEGTLQHRLDNWRRILVGAVADHADVHPVADAFVASGSNRHVVQPTIDRGHQLVALAAIGVAKRFFHRKRLIQQKKKASFILSADLALIGQVLCSSQTVDSNGTAIIRSTWNTG